jgi:hypothetical protein
VRRCRDEKIDIGKFESKIRKYDDIHICDFQVTTRFIDGDEFGKRFATLFVLVYEGLFHIFIPENGDRKGLESSDKSLYHSSRTMYPRTGDLFLHFGDGYNLMWKDHLPQYNVEDTISIQKPLTRDSVFIQDEEINRQGANYRVTRSEEKKSGIFYRFQVFLYYVDETQLMNAHAELRGKNVGRLVNELEYASLGNDNNLKYIIEYLKHSGFGNNAFPYGCSGTNYTTDFNGSFDTYFSGGHPLFKLSVSKGIPGWTYLYDMPYDFPCITNDNKVFRPDQILEAIMPFKPIFCVDVQKNAMMFEYADHEWNCVLRNDLNLIRILQSRFCIFWRLKEVSSKGVTGHIVELMKKTKVKGLYPVQAEFEGGGVGWLKQEHDGLAYGRFDITTFKFICMFSRLKGINHAIATLKRKSDAHIKLETRGPVTIGALNNFLVYMWSMLLLDDSLFFGEQPHNHLWNQSRVVECREFRNRATPKDISFPEWSCGEYKPILNRRNQSNGSSHMVKPPGVYERTRVFRENNGKTSYKWNFRDILYTVEFMENLPMMRTGHQQIDSVIGKNRDLICQTIKRHLDAFLVSAVYSKRFPLVRVGYDHLARGPETLMFRSLLGVNNSKKGKKVAQKVWHTKDLRIKDSTWKLNESGYPAHVKRREKARVRVGQYDPLVLGLGWSGYSVRASRNTPGKSLPRYRGPNGDPPKVSSPMEAESLLDIYS